MSLKLFFVLVALAASPLFVTGCAADTDAPAAAGDEEDVVAASDKQIEKEIAAAVNGLKTGGSEGDPDPYKVVSVKLAKGETTTDAILLSKILPKLKGLGREDDTFPGMQDGDAIAKYWADVTAAPKRADFDTDEDFAQGKKDAAQWKQVQTVVSARLHDVRSVTLGYANEEGGSIETGLVAQVIVGITPSGRAVVIYGFDVWT